MSDKTYNGWTNYATWRVNLEIFDGLDPREMGWTRLKHDLEPHLRDFVVELLESQVASGLALDYALAFIDDVNWYEIARHLIENYEDEEAAA